MRSALLIAVSAAGLLAAGCSTTVGGQGSLPSTGMMTWTQLTGKTLEVPSAAGPATRVPESRPPATSSAPATAPSTTGPSAPPTATTPTPPPESAPAESAPESTPAESTLPGVLSGPVAFGPEPEGYLTFQSPSGNIFCGMTGMSGVDDHVGVRCDLMEAGYPDLAPEPCENGDFHPGTAYLDGNGRGVIGACISDTVVDPSAVVLPYGSNAGAGDVVCHSAEDGVTCADVAVGHGFQVSRTAYRVF